jgi:hypothetical protein
MTANVVDAPVTAQRLASGRMKRCDFISLSLLARWTG